MKETVYVETTVISYLTAWPSRDLVRAGQQQITRDWWAQDAPAFMLLTSELVIIEASAGDPAAAADRLKVLAPLPRLQINQQAVELADRLIDAGAIPSIADRDALHVAVCATNGVQFLLTWNFKHLANANLRDMIVEVCEEAGYAAPIICTPEELTEALP